LPENIIIIRDNNNKQNFSVVQLFNKIQGWIATALYTQPVLGGKTTNLTKQNKSRKSNSSNSKKQLKSSRF